MSLVHYDHRFQEYNAILALLCVKFYCNPDRVQYPKTCGLFCGFQSNFNHLGKCALSLFRGSFLSCENIVAYRDD